MTMGHGIILSTEGSTPEAREPQISKKAYVRVTKVPLTSVDAQFFGSYPLLKGALVTLGRGFGFGFLHFSWNHPRKRQVKCFV